MVSAFDNPILDKLKLREGRILWSSSRLHLTVVMLVIFLLPDSEKAKRSTEDAKVRAGHHVALMSCGVCVSGCVCI